MQKVRIGVVLLCRFSSTRLPGKIFKQISGRPIIDYIVERILTVVDRTHLIVATSTEESDDVIERYCIENNLKFFRGPLEDVAARFLAAGSSQDWQYAVRINGDNLFVATDVMRTLMKEAESERWDFISNTHNKTFPQGMSVEIVRLDFMKKAYAGFSTPNDFEHVTWHFHQNPTEKFLFYDNLKYPDAGQLKFAIDEQKDFDLCTRIFAKFEGSQVEYNMPEIIKIYKSIYE